MVVAVAVVCVCVRARARTVSGGGKRTVSGGHLCLAIMKECGRAAFCLRLIEPVVDAVIMLQFF